MSVFSVTSSKYQNPAEALICRESVEDFRNITIVKALNKAKFSVYLVNSKVTNRRYAMKVFGYVEDKPHLYFLNEARFSFVDHPNVIRTFHAEQERKTVSKGGSDKVSYTIMEFAPHGDFFDFIMNNNLYIDDKLMRTYFRQLIEGIEYLHKSGVSHMDLKLENLLIGEDLNLKIADFDLSYMEGDCHVLSKGTRFYRPPEVIRQSCKNTQAVDIYCAGIILFTFKTRGMLPHAEDNRVSGIDFAGLLYTHNKEFWQKHCEVQQKEDSFFEEDFKELFNSMIRLNPEERATIDDVKRSAWYNGPVYTQEELKATVGVFFNV